MRFDEQIMKATERVVEADFIWLRAKTDDSNTLSVELLDGFNYVWFSKNYDLSKEDNFTKKALLNKIMVDIQKFDVYEELANMIKNNVPGRPCVRTMCKIAFSIERYTHELYFKLLNLKSTL